MKDKNKAKILATGLYRAAQECSKSELEIVATNFSAYLEKHGLVKLIPAVLLELENIYLAEQGIVLAQVAATEKLTAAALQHVHDLVHRQTGKKVQLNAVVDSGLLGGVSIRYEDKIIDLSLKNHLHSLAKQLGT